MTLKINLSTLIAPIYKPFFFNTTAKHLLLTGGRSSCKGDTSYTKAVLECLKDTCVVMVYVPIQDTIKDGCFKQVQTVLNRMGVTYEPKLTTKRILFPNGSEIIFKGMAMENAKKSEESFKGITSDKRIALVIFDELANAEDGNKVGIIQQTFARTSCSFIYIFNPPKDRTSWLFDFKAQMENDAIDDPSTYYTLHTTVYDLVGTGWEAVLSSIEEAERVKKISHTSWLHAYMGEPVGTDMVAFPVIEITKAIPTSFKEFFIFTDNGNVDATVFSLIGLTYNKTAYLLRTFYHSGRESGEQKSDGEYAKILKQFLLESGISRDSKGQIHTRIFTDSKNFALECQNTHGMINAQNVTNKNRAISYSFLKEFLISGKVKIYDSEENTIIVEQLYNAQLEEKYVNGQEKYMIKRPNNNNVPEKRQIHGVDTLLYLAYILAGELL